MKASSYQYDVLTEDIKLKELERLYRQASSMLEIERQLWPHLSIVSGQTLLDVGCGSGVVTKELAEAVYPGHTLGVDYSQSLLDASYSHVEARGAEGSSTAAGDHPLANLSFSEGDIYDLDLPENSFDVVYARLLFQHLSEPARALANLIRVLKPGGRLCVIDVDKGWSGLCPEPDSSVALDQAIIQKQLSKGGDPWVGRKLGYYLSSAGFEQVRTSVELIDSDRLGLDRFFGMLSFGTSYQSEDSDFDRLVAAARPDIAHLASSTHTWAGFGLFVVTGCKPVATEP